MDATVDDFFNEINQISTKNEPKEQLEEVWQECFDELTGYSYFWNTETDQVTWVPPKSYKPADDSNKKNIPPKPENTDKEKKLFVPTASLSAHQYTPASVKPEAKSKVYSIQEVIKHPPEKKPKVKSTAASSSSKPVNRKQHFEKKLPFKRPEDSDEDEKIELITEYGGDSDSDEDGKINKTHLTKPKTNSIDSIKKIPLVEQAPPKSTTIATLNKVLPSVLPSKEEKSQSDEEDEDNDIDLLAKIQQRAQELKQLGGKVPSEVKKIIETTELRKKDEKSKPISAFSLVAGYNSSSSEDEYEPQDTLPTIPIFPVAPIPETSHSTLFPATKPIDVKDFIVPEPLTTSKTALNDGNDNGAPRSDFDSKAFQRKKRIGISLVNNVKRPKGDVEDIPKTDFAGLGFKSENSINGDAEPEASSVYQGFHKGGLMFVKSDVLKPATEEKHNLKEDSEKSEIDTKETEDDYTVLREKLLFLGEGRQPVLPVQAMLIQAETLFLAMKEGGLKLSYLFKWLKEMCSELIKLEKEAAPEGWLLQWDRSHKRYFYQNQASGVSQWHYPEPDVTRCDDAMDISTTPPPPDLPENIKAPKIVEPIVFGPQLLLDPPLPPSPPNIRSPTPPPPPIISMSMDVCQIHTVIPDVPLPPDPQPVVLQPPPPPLKNDQPLPPGVDLLPEAYNKPKEPEVKANDTLTTALDSFYSEIAEVAENANSRSPARISEVPVENAQLDVLTGTEATKKKKKKVKLAQGLTMKKKGVSQLVEKWKNVQKNYSD